MESKTEITLQPKAAFAEENAAFLSEYDTDSKQIDFYTEQAMRIFEEFQIDGSFSWDGVRKNVSMWYQNKRAQMELFRKHPYWSERAKAIIFLQTEVRSIDYDRARRELDRMRDYIQGEDDSFDDERILYVVINALKYEEERCGVITDNFVRHFNMFWTSAATLPKAIKRILKAGTKLTKFVRKCCENLLDEDDDVRDMTGLPMFDKYYAVFADCLSELNVQKITVVSLHFCDFMTMSNGNSWSSCHFINSHGLFHDGDTNESYRGAYKAGCLSYALDRPSFLLYTLPSSYEGNEYYRQQKLNRMCCQYEEGILITGKCYPNNQDTLITRYRQMMQLILAQIEEVPNLWSFSRKLHKIRAFVETADNSAHYEDYLYEKQSPTISFCRAKQIDPDHTIEIGHAAYCLNCGDELEGDEQNWLQCGGACRRKRVCAHCGRVIGKDENIHVYDDEVYCDDCVFYCDYCEQYEPINRQHSIIDTHNGVIQVCEYGLSHYIECSYCGRYAKRNDCTNVSGKMYYNKCLEQLPKCNRCGRHVHKLNSEGLCEVCAKLANGELVIEKRERYHEGDYVLMAEDVSNCAWTSNISMRRHYPNRIVKIKRASRPFNEHHDYRVSNLDGSDWAWCQNCLAGIVYGATDADVGKTIEEFLEARS